LTGSEDFGVYALAKAEERESRRQRLAEPHMAPLTHLVDEMRAENRLVGEIPYFDPEDGGVDARVLFLLEAPGPRAVTSGFISRNNPDPTARNFLRLLKEAGIAREISILWNIVPWYIGTGKQIRAARASDIRAGQKYLRRLLALLSNLKAVVLVGGKAQVAADFVSTLTKVRIFKTLHPSSRVVICWPEKRVQLLNELQKVKDFVDHGAHWPATSSKEG